MTRIEHSLDIAAPAERVWALTVDVAGWPRLTPATVTSVTRLEDTPLSVGSRTRIKQPGQRPTVWTVDRLDEPNRFRWSAKVGTISMVADHRIESTAAGCRNHLSIELGGFGSGLLARIAGERIKATIATENECFRRAAEAR